jgi:lipopolysaccharide/colanic/teichoic acid biosynthesis glycosyltransferase
MLLALLRGVERWAIIDAIAIGVIAWRLGDLRPAAALCTSASTVLVGVMAGLYDWNLFLQTLPTVLLRIVPPAATGALVHVWLSPSTTGAGATTVLAAAFVAAFALPRLGLGLAVRARRPHVAIRGGGPLAQRIHRTLEREFSAVVEPVLDDAAPHGTVCGSREGTALLQSIARLLPVPTAVGDWALPAVTPPSAAAESAKRTFDIAVALALLVPAAAVGIVAAVDAVRRGESVLYSQLRVGRHGRPFRILKFRTMHAEAEQDGPLWASGNDPRQTRLGRVLRRLRLDELPQAVNVLRGEMSIVGPRPERPEFAEELEQKLTGYSQRHLLPPGVTGWAQLNWPYGSSVADAHRKLEYDLYYLHHRSLLLDVRIALRTVVAGYRGAR